MSEDKHTGVIEGLGNSRLYKKLEEQAQKDSKKLKQIAGILKRQLRASGMVHKINEVLNNE